MRTGRTPCEYEDRGWGEVSMSQGTLKAASKPPTARREAWTRPFPQDSEGANPPDTLTADLHPSGP